jgi:hypothetical protein
MSGAGGGFLIARLHQRLRTAPADAASGGAAEKRNIFIETE